MAGLYDSYDVAIELLKFNTFWTLLPDFLAHHHRAVVQPYFPKDWDAEYRISALWPKYRLRTQVLDRVIQDVKESVASAASKI